MRKLLPIIIFLSFNQAVATTVDVLYVFDDSGFDPAVDTLAKELIEVMSNSTSGFTYNVTLEDDNTWSSRTSLTGFEMVIFGANCNASLVDLGPDISTYSGSVISMFYGSTSLNSAMGLGTAQIATGITVRYRGPDTTFINLREYDTLRAYYVAGSDGARGKILSTNLAANAKTIFTDVTGGDVLVASLDSGVANASGSTNHGRRVFLGSQAVQSGYRDWSYHAPFRREIQRSVCWAAGDTSDASWVENVIWIGYAREMGNGWNEIGGAANCASAGPSGESFDSSIYTSINDFHRFGYDAQDPTAYFDPVGIDQLVPEGKIVDSAFYRVTAYTAGIENLGDSFNVSTGLFPVIAYDSTVIAPFWYERNSAGGCPEDYTSQGGRLINGVTNRYGRDLTKPWAAKDFLRGVDIPLVPWDSIRWSWDGSAGSIKFDTNSIARAAGQLSFSMDPAGVQSWVDKGHKGFILKGLVLHGGDVEIGGPGDRMGNRNGLSNSGVLLRPSGVEIYLSVVVDTVINEGDSLVLNTGLGSDSTHVIRGDSLYSYRVFDTGTSAILHWKTEIGYYPDTANIVVYEKKDSDTSIVDSFTYKVAFNQWAPGDTLSVDTPTVASYPVIIPNDYPSNDTTWTIIVVDSNVSLLNPSTAAGIQIRATAKERVLIELCPTCTLMVSSSTFDQSVYGIEIQGNSELMDSVIIRGGTVGIRVNGFTSPATTNSSAAIYASNPANLMIIDVNTFAQDTGGVGGYCIYTEGVSTSQVHFTDSITDTSETGAYRGAYNLLVLRGSHENRATRYVNRQNDPGSVFSFTGLRPWDSLLSVWPNIGAHYQIKIENVTIPAYSNRGISAQGRVDIFRANITPTVQNALYMGPDSLRGMAMTRGGVLDNTMDGRPWDSIPCYDCASTVFEAGRLQWVGPGPNDYGTLTGTRTNTVASGGPNQDSVWSDDWYTATSIGNPYAISITNGTGRRDTSGGNTFVANGAAHGTRVAYVTVNPDPNYYGGYGILLQHPDGTPNDPVVIEHNYMVGFQARSPQSNQGYTARQRWGGDNVVWRYNTFINIIDGRSNSDTAGSFAPYEYEGKAMQIGANHDAGENSGQFRDYQILYNTLICSTATGGVPGKGFGLNIDNYLDPNEDTSFNQVVRGNVIQGTRAALGLGTFEAGNRSTIINENLIQTTGDTTDNYVTVLVGSYDRDSRGNILLDENFTFTGTGVWSDIYFQNNNNTDTSDIYVKEIVGFTVMDVSGSPLSGVSVSGVNGYGQTIMNKTTNASGVAIDTITVLYKSMTGGVLTADSTQFNDFIFTFSKTGYQSKSDTITFSPATPDQVDTLQSSGGPSGSPAMIYYRSVYLKGVQ